MPKPDKPSHSTKRIALPGGKEIEVVQFFDPSGEAETDQLRAEAQRELHICQQCGSKLVYPTQWHESDAEHWHITLRCPSCEWTESGIFCQELADRFDEELERGTEAVIRELKRLTRTHMAEAIDCFGAALRADAIQPMDF